MWNPETDACDECRECDYFLHEYWNCQGESEPCHEFYPKLGSNKKTDLNWRNYEICT